MKTKKREFRRKMGSYKERYSNKKKSENKKKKNKGINQKSNLGFKVNNQIKNLQNPKKTFPKF